MKTNFMTSFLTINYSRNSMEFVHEARNNLYAVILWYKVC